MELTCDSERAEEVFICLLFARASLLSFNVQFRTLSQRFAINIRRDTSLKVDENISISMSRSREVTRAFTVYILGIIYSHVYV